MAINATPTPTITASDAFLDGQGVAVEFARIEDALDELWGPAAELAGGPDIDQPSVTRVVLANIVVVALNEESARVGRTVEAITGEYPSRTIVIRPGGPDRAIGAELAAVCHLPSSGRAQVCSERIILRAGPNALELLPGAVRSLLLSDLHHVVWCADDPALVPHLLAQLAEDATRLILDRPDPGPDPAGLAAILEDSRDPLPRDLSWYAITPWREIIAPLFDTATSHPAIRAVESLVVRSETNEGGQVPRLAVWLASWFAGQFGWRPDTVERGADGQLLARFQGESGPVNCSFETQAGPPGLARIVGVEWTLRGEGSDAGAGSFRLSRVGPDEAGVRVEVHCASHCELPRMVVAAPGQIEQWIAAALQADRVDPPYRRAMPIARWLLPHTCHR